MSPSFSTKTHCVKERNRAYSEFYPPCKLTKQKRSVMIRCWPLNHSCNPSAIFLLLFQWLAVGCLSRYLSKSSHMTRKEDRTERDVGKYMMCNMVMRYLERVSDKATQGIWQCSHYVGRTGPMGPSRAYLLWPEFRVAKSIPYGDNGGSSGPCGAETLPLRSNGWQANERVYTSVERLRSLRP